MFVKSQRVCYSLRPINQHNRFIMKRFGLLCLLVIGVLGIVTPTAAEEPLSPRPSLRLPFLPGETYVVTCGYGCYQHQGSMFYAVDFATPEGTPIVAAADGVVAAITWEVGLPLSKNLGDALILYIDHSGGWFTRYVHLNGVTVAVGDAVRQGDIVGYAGHTGAEGAHLHFELKYGAHLHAPSQPIDDLFGGEPPHIGQAYLAEAITFAPTDFPTPTPSSPTSLHSSEPPDGLSTPLIIPVSPTISPSTIAAGETFTLTLTLANTSTKPLQLPIVGIAPRQNDVLVPNHLTFMRDINLAPHETRTISFSLTLPAGTYLLSPFAFSKAYTLLPLGVANNTAPAIHLTVAGQNIFLPLVGR